MVEGYRDERGRVRHRVVANLGRKEALKASGQPARQTDEHHSLGDLTDRVRNTRNQRTHPHATRRRPRRTRDPRLRVRTPSQTPARTGRTLRHAQAVTQSSPAEQSRHSPRRLADRLGLKDPALVCALSPGRGQDAPRPRPLDTPRPARMRPNITTSFLSPTRFLQTGPHNLLWAPPPTPTPAIPGLTWVSATRPQTPIPRGSWSTLRHSARSISRARPCPIFVPARAR